MIIICCIHFNTLFLESQHFCLPGAPGSGAFVMQDRQGDVARPLSKPLGYVFDGNFALWGAL